MGNSKKLITPEDYAEKHGVTIQTVYNRIKAGRVKTERMFKKMLIIE